MNQLQLNREHLTRGEKRQEYLRGFILEEHRMHSLAFIFAGNQYISSARRARRGDMYSFTSQWHYARSSNTLYKLWLIATQRVHKVQ